MKSKRHLLQLLLILSCCLYCILSINARKIKQVHKIESSHSRYSRENERDEFSKRTVASDSLLADSITFSGYDKPINSTTEIFLISNNTYKKIKKAGIRITYLDLQNRMLHSREAEVECEIPSGETRLASTPSWDRQHTFYYYLGQEPRRVATPYKVSIDLIWIEQ